MHAMHATSLHLFQRIHHGNVGVLEEFAHALKSSLAHRQVFAKVDQVVGVGVGDLGDAFVIKGNPIPL